MQLCGLCHQNSVNRCSCSKLSKKFYGPFKILKKFYGPLKILKKINSITYQLQLPEGNTIFPIFHISLLKPFQGSQLETTQSLLPPLAKDAHTIICPTQVIAFHKIISWGQKFGKALVERTGLLLEERPREDLETIYRLVPTSNLEDKLHARGSNDLTVDLDIQEGTECLRKDLETTDFGDNLTNQDITRVEELEPTAGPRSLAQSSIQDHQKRGLRLLLNCLFYFMLVV